MDIELYGLVHGRQLQVLFYFVLFEVLEWRINEWINAFVESYGCGEFDKSLSGVAYSASQSR